MSGRYTVFLALALTLTCITATSKETDVSARNAWVRETPPGVAMMAGYMVLRNNTSKSQVLVAASSPGFESVMIHRAIVKDGMAGMEHVPQIKLSPYANFLFEPGGYHLMLLKPKRTLHAGDRVDINLEFHSGMRLPVSFEVRK